MGDSSRISDRNPAPSDPFDDPTLNHDDLVCEAPPPEEPASEGPPAGGEGHARTGAPAPTHGHPGEDTYQEGGEHDGGEHTQHLVHQIKLGVHGVEQFGEGLHHIAVIAQARREAAALAESAHKALRPVAGVAESLSPAQVKGLQSANATLDQFRGLQQAAQQASSTQSSIASQISRLLKTGADPARVQALRDELAIVERTVNGAYKAVNEAKPAADAAKASVRVIVSAASEAQRDGSLVQRALAAVAETQTGQRALRAVQAAAESRVGSALATIANSKVVRVGGKVLIATAVVADGIMATREDATIGGNAFRAVGQGATSAVLYTQAPLVPVLIAEGFFMDKPHITGPLQSAVQTGGVAVDYLTGGSDAGDRALTGLDHDMKEGRYGAVIKGANYFGQSLADEGVSGTARQTVSYWSEASPSGVWRDAKSIYSWLTE